MAKVSVIIPVYNASKYLEQCLDSILFQTLKDIEIICVDDGSTDNSLDILNKYKENDSRIKVLTQKNSYAGVARNVGMDIAVGEYLVFFDADDFCEKDMLQEMYNKCKQDNAQICLCSGRIYNEESKEFINASYYLNKKYLPEAVPFSANDIAECLFSIVPPAPWNKMFKADFVRENNIRFQPIKKTNDLFFSYFALACSDAITYVNKPFVNYRTGNNNSLQGSVKILSTDFYSALIQLKRELTAKNLFIKYEKTFVNRALATCVYNLDRADLKENFINLVDNMRNTYFYRLNLLGHSRSYFYIGKDYDVLLDVMMKTSEQLWEERNPSVPSEQIGQPLLDINEWISPIAISSQKKIKISVIIPIYNMEKYLPECIDSVINNTLKDIEIICVDDGSTDSSLAILKDYEKKDSRIKIIEKENGGLSSSRNSGIAIAQGEYILFLDSDDYIETKALEYLYCEAKAENLDQLFFSAKSFYDDVDLEQDFKLDKYIRTADYTGVKTGRKLFSQMSKNAEFKPSACLQLIRKEFLDKSKITFLEGVLFEDNLFTIQLMSLSERVRYDNINLYNRRIREGSIMTSSDGIKNSYSYYKIIKNIEEFSIANNFSADREFMDAVLLQLKRIDGNANTLLKNSTDKEICDYLYELPPEEIIDFAFYIKFTYEENKMLLRSSKMLRNFKEKAFLDECKRKAQIKELEEKLKDANNKLIAQEKSSTETTNMYARIKKVFKKK